MSTGHSEKNEQAERLKKAVIESIVDAYEDAGIRGLCGEGRFEMAVDAVRGMDFSRLLDESAEAEDTEIELRKSLER